MIFVRRAAPAIAVVTVALTAPLVTPAQAQETQPTVTVRVLPSQATYSRPLDMLENGVVVGNDGPTTTGGDPPGVDAGHPWIWLGGRMRPLPIGDADSGFVVDAAEPGLATGSVTRTDPATGTQRQDAVVWRDGGAPAAVAPDLAQGSRAVGINRRGDVLINATNPQIGGQQPLLVAADGTRTAVSDTYLTFGLTLDDSRDVLFSRIEPGGFGSIHHWFRGTAKQLTGSASGRFGIPLCASGTSNSGWVAWSYYADLGQGVAMHPTLRRRAGDDIPLPLPAGVTSAEISCESNADAVNERGHAVGRSLVPGPSHACCGGTGPSSTSASARERRPRERWP